MFYMRNEPISHMNSDKIKTDLCVGAGFPKALRITEQSEGIEGKPALVRKGSTANSKRAGLNPAPTWAF